MLPKGLARTLAASAPRRLRLSVRAQILPLNQRRWATWGFIGLGQMGYPMAANLHARISADDSLLVFDINKSTTEQFVHKHNTGAQVRAAQYVREIGDHADTVITMLPEPAHVKSVYEEIVLQDRGDSKQRLFIDSSTIDLQTSLQVGKAVRLANSEFVDAPVSGGVVGAKAGTLTFMLGASEGAAQIVTPILEKMGRRVIHMGKPGSGIAGKLTNNYLLAINNLGTAEAMNMGIKLGLDPIKLAGLLNCSTGRCWPTEVNNPVPGVVDGAPAGRNYDGGFGISLMAKDLRLAISAATSADAKLILADSAQRLYNDAEKTQNCKGKDFSVVYRYIQESGDHS